MIKMGWQNPFFAPNNQRRFSLFWFDFCKKHERKQKQRERKKNRKKE